MAWTWYQSLPVRWTMCDHHRWNLVSHATACLTHQYCLAATIDRCMKWILCGFGCCCCCPTCRFRSTLSYFCVYNLICSTTTVCAKRMQCMKQHVCRPPGDSYRSASIHNTHKCLFLVDCCFVLHRRLSSWNPVEIQTFEYGNQPTSSFNSSNYWLWWMPWIRNAHWPELFGVQRMDKGQFLSRSTIE